MARTTSNPLPEFISSPSLGAVLAGELLDLAARLSADLAAGAEPQWLDGIRIGTIRTAADQLRRYHRNGTGHD